MVPHQSQNMPETQTEKFYLCHFAETAYKDIAKKLRIKFNTVKII